MKIPALLSALTSPPPHRRALRARILQLTWPVILANLTIPLVGLADTALVGHLGSAHYIGGVALGSFLAGLVGLTFNFFRLATTGLVAQAHGADDGAGIIAVFLRGVIIAVLLGITVIAVTPRVIAVARIFFDASPAVLDGMEVYMRIAVWASPAVFFNMVGLGVLFGMQRARTCMVQLVAVNCINIAGNVFFVLGLGMKIEGVALATVIAHYAGAAIVLVPVLRALRLPDGGGQIPGWREVLDFAAMGEYATLGRDLVIRTFCLLIGEMMVLNASAGLGDAELAATQIGFVLFRLVAYGLDGFAQTAEMLVGHAIGSRDTPRLKAVIADSTLAAFLLALGMAAAIVILAPLFFAAMTTLADVRAAGGRLVFWLALIPPVAVFTFQLDGIFIGATLGRIMRNAMLFSVVLFIPVILLAARHYGMHGIWAAFLFLLAMRGFTLWRKIGHVHAKAKGT